MKTMQKCKLGKKGLQKMGKGLKLLEHTKLKELVNKNKTVQNIQN